MRLSKLTSGLRIERQDAEASLEIDGLAYDSRRVKQGELFFAVPGFKSDGHGYLAEAAAAGATAAVTERWVDAAGMAQVQVPDVRNAMAAMANTFYGDPASKLRTIGVTGTNGKTTTTFLVDSILRAAGLKTALIGGITYNILDRSEAASRTTPEAIDLQRLLAEAVRLEVDAVTMEVSSHGIELARTDCLGFDVAAFTNLSHDHLDLHGDMEAYYQVKRRLFIHGGDGGCSALEGGPSEPRPVINIDDLHGRRLAGEVSREPVSFGLAADASVRAGDIVYSGWRTRMSISVPEGTAELQLNLPGEFNLHNTLAAAGVAVALDLSLEAIVTGLEDARGAPGRFERLEVDVPFRVVLDYAHNEDGLRRVLTTARNITPGRLITVFGCPGERDRDKRPGMGRIAASLSDLAILTTDDCYEEPPARILADVEAGLWDSGGDFRIIADRREAIEFALEAATGRDTVLVAGKGHEQVQRMPDGAHPFSDRKVIMDAVAASG